MASSNKDVSSELSVSPRGRRSYNSMSPPGRMKLNVKPAKITNLVAPKSQTSQKLKNGVSPAPQQQYSRRKQWVLNPFKQEDEDEVLAKRNHNSRRWSHVFPQGEIEFKRHAGPNFKSVSKCGIFYNIPFRYCLLAHSHSLPLTFSYCCYPSSANPQYYP